MAIDAALMHDLVRTVRVKSDTGKEEIMELVESCKKDLEIAGIYVTDETEPLCKQAIKLYCKGHYGYDKDSERFLASYSALKDSMALSGEYKKAGDSDG